MIYNYFISYTINNGSGIIFLERGRRIKNFEDIKLINIELLKHIGDKSVKIVFVNNFILVNWKFGKVIKNV